MADGGDPGARYCTQCGVLLPREVLASTATCDTVCQTAAYLAAHCALHGLAPTADPWTLPALAPVASLGAAMPVTVAGMPSFFYGLGMCSRAHGVLTALTHTPHERVPVFAAWPEGRRWWLLTRRTDVLRELPERRLIVPVGTERREVSVGTARWLVAPPPRPRGRYRVRVETDTPVLIRSRTVTGSRHKLTTTSPTATALASTLGETLAPRLGHAAIWRTLIPVEGIDHATEPVTIQLPRGCRIGGDDRLRGWAGWIEVETSGLGAGLLECAAALGLGGRVAYGFGRVRVEVQRVE